MLDLWQTILGGLALVPLYVTAWAFFFSAMRRANYGTALAGFVATLWPVFLPAGLVIAAAVVLVAVVVLLIAGWIMSWTALVVGGFPKVYQIGTNLA